MMPIDPYCTECRKVTGGCPEHSIFTVAAVNTDPGCSNHGNPLGPMPQHVPGETYDAYMTRLFEEFWARAGKLVRARKEET